MACGIIYYPWFSRAIEIFEKEMANRRNLDDKGLEFVLAQQNKRSEDRGGGGRGGEKGVMGKELEPGRSLPAPDKR